MSYSKKVGKSKLKKTAHKIFSASMAVSFALTPFAPIVSAAEDGKNGIVRTDGTNIDFVNNIADIYAEEINSSNSIGINRFEYFDVTNGQIANLYFTDANKTAWVNTLVNLVQNKINVAGAVNAIKDGKIDGNLYFLSPQGMVVSGSGVINAGSLTVAIPTTDFLEKMKLEAAKTDTNSTTNDSSSTEAKTVNLWNASSSELQQVLSNNPNGLTTDIALNSSGTIQLEGKVNVANVAKMMANEITVEKGSELRNAIDFSSISNVGTNQTIQDEINAGRNALTTRATDEGIYILGVEKVDMNGTVNAVHGKAQIKAENSKTVDLGKIDKNTKLVNYQDAGATAEVNIGGTVIGESVDISAVATTTFKGETVNAPKEEKKKDDTSKSDAKTEEGKSGDADDGTLTKAGKKVYNALKKNESFKAVSDKVEALIDKTNVMIDENTTTATVNIKQGSTIKSSGDTSIKAESTSTSTMTLTVQPKNAGSSSTDTGKTDTDKTDTDKTDTDKTDTDKTNTDTAKTADDSNNTSTDKEAEEKAKKEKAEKESNTSIADRLLVGAANYNSNKTTATVNIEGDIAGEAGNRNVQGKLDIAANATSSTTIKTTIKQAKSTSKKEDASTTGYFTAALNIVNHDTNAAVNIAEGKTVAAKGDVSVGAASKTTLDVTAKTAVDNGAAAATAINILNVDTNANVNNNGTITSDEGKVTLSATNSYTKLSVTTDNAYNKADDGKKEEKKDDTKTDDTKKEEGSGSSEDQPSAGEGTGESTGGDSGSGSGDAGDSGSGSGDSGDEPAAPAADEDENVIEDEGASGAAEGLQAVLGGDDSTNSSGLKGSNKNADDKTSATSGDTDATKKEKGTTDTDKKEEASTKDDSKKSDSKTGWNQYFDVGASVMVGNFTNKATVNN